MNRKHPDPRIFWTVAIAGGVGMAVAGRYVARRRRYFDLRGRNVLVTGGSRGLGLVLARQLLRHGAHVVICARDSEELAAAKSDLEAIAGDVLTAQCDLTNPDDIAAMLDGISALRGTIDVLINNAGIIQVGPAQNMTDADYQQAMDIHFWAPYHLTRAVLPGMRARGGGRIVNISSIGGKVPPPHLVPYVASKFALTGFSQALRAELARDNIYVTTVSPGLMRTGSPRNIEVAGQTQKEYAWFKISDSLPGLSISPERAARRIIDALVHGDADLTIGLVAKIGYRFHALFPNLSQGLSTMVNHFLPAPGSGPRRVKGWQAESPITQSKLTRLTDDAARRNNEIQE